MNTQELNKQVVRRFNAEILEKASGAFLSEIMAPDFVNRTAPPFITSDAVGMLQMARDVLHRGLSQIRIEFHDQVAEGDLVSSRKTIHGVHTGEFLGAAPTGRTVAISVMDMVRLRDGKYVEHWGFNNLLAIVDSLKK